MNQVLDVLLLRRVRLEYISPPICQAILSGSGSSLMLAAVLGPEAPQSLEFSGQCERFLTWVGSDETVCTSLYKAQNPLDPLTLYVLEAECLAPGNISVCSDGWWCYSTLTADGVESDRSEPVLSPLIGARVNIPVTIPDGAVRLNLFRNPDPSDVNGTYSLVLSTTALGGAFEVCDLTGCYKLQTISNDGASDLSAPLCHSTFAGCIPYVLTDILGPNERCCIGVPFSTTLEAVGGSGPFLWEVATGSLPPGMTLQPGPFPGPTTTIDGTPTAGGDYNFSIRCTDASGHELVKPFSLSSFGISDFNTGLTAGKTDTYYLFVLTATGGTAPYTFGPVVDGALPNDLSLDVTGSILGYPREIGDFNFSVTVTDANGVSCVTPLSLSITGCPASSSPGPTFALTGQTAILFAGFDESRRTLWIPKSVTSGAPPYQTIYRAQTKLPTPNWISDATDSLNLINTSAKGDLGGGTGQVLYSKKYDGVLVFGQGWTAFYSAETGNCVNVVQHTGPRVTRCYLYQPKYAYDDVNGYLYLPVYSTPASVPGLVQVFDCNPAVLNTIAEYHFDEPTYHYYQGGNLAFVPGVTPGTGTVYLCNTNTGPLYHKWDIVSHTFTMEQGPAFGADVTPTVHYFAGAKLLVFRCYDRLIFIDPFDSDNVVANTVIGSAGGGINWADENLCEADGSRYFFASA